MGFDPLTAAFDLGKIAIEKIWPDPTRRAEELRKLEELKSLGQIAELNARVKLILAQLEINKVEATHKSIFVAGWRPAIGWVGVVSLAYAGVIYPILNIYIENMPPLTNIEVISSIVIGMLGIGGMRSFDKRGGVNTDSIR